MTMDLFQHIFQHVSHSLMSLIHSLRIWYHIQISFSLLSAHQFNVNEKSFLCGRRFLSNLLYTSILMLAGCFPMKHFLTTLSFVQLIFKVNVCYKNYVTTHITFLAPDISLKRYLTFWYFLILLISWTSTLQKWRENKITINISQLIMQQTCFKWWLMLLALVHAHQQNINWSWSIKRLLINFVTFIIPPQNSSDNMNIDRVTYDGIH